MGYLIRNKPKFYNNYFIRSHFMFTTKSLICISFILVFTVALQDGDEIAFKTHGNFYNANYQYLNAGTVDGSVGMAKNTDYTTASGTWWRAHKLSDGSWGFESLGSIPNDQHIYLNANTYTGEVNLAGSTDYATVSGTHWNLVSLSDGTVALKNLGSHSNPAYMYLNTNTYTGAVSLAGSTDYNSLSGTHWEIVTLAPAPLSGTSVVGTIGNAVAGAAGTVGDAVTSAADTVGTSVTEFAGDVGELGMEIGNDVTGAAGAVGGAVTSAAGDVGGAVTSAAGDVGSALSDVGHAICPFC